jgi:hypothetical protein
MTNRLILLIFIGVFQANVGHCQSQVVDSLDFETVIENLLPQQEYDFNYNDLYDKLFTLYSNPIDLNSAERMDFQALFFLSESEIDAILNHRQKYGNFITVFELQGVEGIDRVTIKKLLPFIKILPPGNEFFTSKLKSPDVHEVIMRYQTDLEVKKGYQPPDTSASGELSTRYAGNPGRIFSRYTYSRSSSYSFGFTVEKDPGEQIIWDPSTDRYGLDYYSFHGMVENLGVVKKVIVGDFNMDHGQGLIFGSGLRVGKGFEPITTVRRNNLGLRPYRSVYESKDFSGAAIECSLKGINFTLFYSKVNRDAVLKEGLLDTNDPAITSIQEMGLHRTPSEIMAKHALTDKSIGGSLHFSDRNGKVQVGLNALLTEYNFPIVRGSKPYQYFNFSGFQNHVGSVYANWFLRNGHIFGELASSNGGGYAISTGVLKSLTPGLQMAIHYRNYSRNYHSFYGSAFGVNSTTSNEQGIYWGLKFTPYRDLLITTYFDFYKFPWLKYRVDAPSEGREFMISAQWRQFDRVGLTVQYRQRLSQENQSIENSPYAELMDKNRKQLYLVLDNQVHKNLSLRTKLQFTKVRFGMENYVGIMIAQDVSYSMKKTSFSIRYSMFDADDYDSRIFIYEREVLHGYYMPSYYGQGLRYYLVARHDITTQISFWIKFGQTKYFDKETIGSGLEEIDGTKRTSVTVQLRFRF